MSERFDNGHWTILLGGTINPSARLKAQTSATRVIAADSGMRHSAPLGLEPELWVGDFDSSDRALQAAHAEVVRETHPVAKYETDGALAIHRAVEQGATQITLVGAFGGQADQATAHILIALQLAKAGIGVLLCDGRQEGIVVGKEPTAPTWPRGTVFSLLAFSDLSGVTIRAAKWELDAAAIPQGSTVGLSNVAAHGLELAVQEGQCIAVAMLN